MTPLLADAARKARAVLRRGREVGIGLGLLPYRPIGTDDPGVWDSAYESGAAQGATGTPSAFARLAEAPRYGALLAYFGAVAEEPSVLDIGCGAGVLRARLARVPFSRYVGTDVSSVAVEQATAALGDDRTTFEVAAVPPAELGTFDIVVCNEMLYYVRDLPALLGHVAGSLLVPGGHVLSSVWRHRGDAALFRMLDEHFTPVDAVDLRSTTDRRLRWRVSCHRRP